MLIATDDTKNERTYEFDYVTGAPTGRHKWLDHLRLTTVGGPQLSDAPHRLLHPKLDVTEYEKDEADLFIINHSLGRINRLRAKVGLPGVTINPDRIHLTNRQSMRELGLQADASNLELHAYVAMDDAVQGMCHAIHELTHLTSFNSDVTEMRWGDGDWRDVASTAMRSGLFEWHADGRSYGRGLNEAVTESIACHVRRTFRDADTRRLDHDVREAICGNPGTYVEHRRLLNNILTRLTKRFDRHEVMLALFHGYFAGTTLFEDLAATVMPRKDLLELEGDDDVDFAAELNQLHFG